MRGFVAVARREIAENRMALLAALIAGMSPIAVPIVRNFHGVNASEERSLVAFFAAVTLAAGLSIALGFSTLSQGISNRRIGFFFDRPLSSLTIWAGKLTGVAALALAAALIATLPTLLVNGGNLQMPFGWSLWLFLALALLLIPVSHVLSVALRSRTAWLALDLALALLVALIAGASTRALIRELAGEALARGLIGLAAFVLAAFLVAGLAAVAQGRTDIRRAHRALSLSLWAIVGTGVLALAGYTRWVLSATPRSLTEVSFVAPAQRGSWVIVEGPARGFSPAFLMDTSSDRFERVGSDWRLPVLSADGSHAAWFEFADEQADVMTLALEHRSSRPVRTRITLPEVPALAMLAAGGERLATVSQGMLSVYDLVAGATVGSARVGDKCGRPAGFFLDSQRLRLFCPSAFSRFPGAVRLEILEFDTSTKKLAKTGTIEDVDWGTWSVNPAGDRLLARGAGEGITLRDGKSGALLAALRPPGPGASRGGRFLSDGRIALGIADETGTRVEIFSSDGKPEGTLPIGAPGRIVFGGEAASGLLVVAAGGNPGERASRTIFLADLASGRVRRAGDRLFPTVFLAGLLSGRPNYVPAPGSEATKLFYGPGRSLIRFDALTGNRRVILGSSGP